jgi:dihydrofolate reductase
MTRTRYYCAATLDGYIAEADDTIDWLTGYEGHYEGDGAPPVEGGYDDFYAEMLASAGDGDLWIVGGGNVASQFADAGLLDEVAVTIVPVVLGEGKPLFDRRLPGGAMQLKGVFPRANGMVGLRYAIT